MGGEENIYFDNTLSETKVFLRNGHVEAQLSKG